MLAVILEVAYVLLQFIFYWLQGIVLALLPAKVRGLKDISRQTVLVTGAGSGLGRLLAIQFAKRGCQLVLWDVNTKGNEETATMVKEFGTTVFTYTVDLSDREKIYKTADQVKDKVGFVDILVNNAGIVTGRKFLDCSDDMIQKTMDVNIMAHFWTAKAFLPGMLSQNSGHIVTIASAAGFAGVPGLADYCASKFAAVGFDESIRNELTHLKKTGVHTTVVCPYYINTGMFDGVKTRFPALLPILDPDYVTDKIMEAVLTNQELVAIPKSIYLANALKGIVPFRCSFLLSEFLGLNKGMEEFRGRQKAA